MKLLLLILLNVFSTPEIISIHDEYGQKGLDSKYIQVLEDTSRRLSFSVLLNSDADSLALIYGLSTDRIQNIRSDYWVIFTIDFDNQSEYKLIEFTDPHIKHLKFYFPLKGGQSYDSLLVGMGYEFSKKPVAHKNFVFDPDPGYRGKKTFYANISSDAKSALGVKLSSVSKEIEYTENEYLLLGIFYGILLIMSILNLALFIFLKEKVHFFYVLYVVSCGFLFLSEDGLGFQYIWPGHPFINNLVNEYSPLVFLLGYVLYTKIFLETRKFIPLMDRVIEVFTLVFASGFLLSSFTDLFNWDYRIYIIPCLLLYSSGWLAMRKGNAKAWYFIIGQTFILVGLIFLVMRRIGVDFFENVYTIYSLNAAFIIDITIASYALGDKVQNFKNQRLKVQRQWLSEMKERHRAQRTLLKQMKENHELKDKVNRELESEVIKRTEKIEDQKAVIASKNEELTAANEKLKMQAQKINEMNVYLDKDNFSLKKDIRSLHINRILSKEVSFTEFERIFPDKIACLKFLAELKWGEGFCCKKCSYDNFSKGKAVYTRRCSRCGYEESATAYTIYHKCKFDLNKAFYITYSVYIHNDEVSSVHLSKVLNLRQGTCWSFIQKAATAFNSRDKKEIQSWSEIIQEMPV